MVNDGRDLAPLTTSYASWADELRDHVERQESFELPRLLAELEDERQRFYDAPGFAHLSSRERPAAASSDFGNVPNLPARDDRTSCAVASLRALPADGASLRANRPPAGAQGSVASWECFAWDPEAA
jgi:hypothetical protein